MISVTMLLSVVVCFQLADCLHHAAAPMDGATLTTLLHQWGVNVRYLGTLLGELDRMEGRRKLSHIRVITTCAINHTTCV